MTALLQGFVPSFHERPLAESAADLYERRTKIDALGRRRTRPSVADRLWCRIDMSAGLDGCWPWTRATTRQGYGEISMDGAMETVHRVVYRALIGPIPEGLHVDHLCHSRSTGCPTGPTCLHRRCANPTHLEAVPCVVNIRRGAELIDRCVHGHAFTSENTAYTTRGHRRCRECHRLERRRAYVPRPRKATPEVRGQIVAMRGEGLTTAAIGARVGLSQSFVARLLQREARSLPVSDPRAAEDMAQADARAKGGELWVCAVFAGKRENTDGYATYVDPDKLPPDGR